MRFRFFRRGGEDDGTQEKRMRWRDLGERNASPDALGLDLGGGGGLLGGILPTVSASLDLLGGGAADATTTASTPDATTAVSTPATSSEPAALESATPESTTSEPATSVVCRRVRNSTNCADPE